VILKEFDTCKVGQELHKSHTNNETEKFLEKFPKEPISLLLEEKK